MQSRSLDVQFLLLGESETESVRKTKVSMEKKVNLRYGRIREGVFCPMGAGIVISPCSTYHSHQD